jgi:hypothetical protein
MQHEMFKVYRRKKTKREGMRSEKIRGMANTL